MIINHFALYFVQQYNRSQKCIDCPNECPETGNCQKCLERWHWGLRESAYDCPNIRYYYIGHYLHKYSSEIGYLFRSAIINELTEFNILSLGCGPCPDYLGIVSVMKQTENTKDIRYLGIDFNEKWSSFHDWIKQNTQSPFNVIHQDVYNFLGDPLNTLKSYQPNIVIISYLVSDLLKADRDIEDLINLFVGNLLPILPANSFIIINDYNRGINSNDPRSWYEKFKVLMEKNRKVSVWKLHFKHNYRNFHLYDTQHQNNDILFPVPPEFDKFNPWRFCSSAQLIIKTLE